MIIIISGPQGSGQSTFARLFADSITSTDVDVIEGIPNRKPKIVHPVTIFMHQRGTEMPKWVEKQPLKNCIIIENFLIAINRELSQRARGRTF